MYQSNTISTIQRALSVLSFLEGCGLGHSNLVDQQTNTALGDNIGHRVSQLNKNHHVATTDSKHGKYVDNWVPVSVREKWQHMSVCAS